MNSHLEKDFCSLLQKALGVTELGKKMMQKNAQGLCYSGAQ